MTTLEAKIGALEARLHRLYVNGEENAGVRRKIERQIRDLKKQLEKEQAKERR